MPETSGNTGRVSHLPARALNCPVPREQTMKALCNRILESRWFNPFIITVIVAAGVLVGSAAFPEMVERYPGPLPVLNKIILWIFAAEVVVKMTTQSPRPWRYFRDPWNCFDCLIIAVCFLPVGGGSAAPFDCCGCGA